MKPYQKQLAPFLALALLIQGCATTAPGSDPIVVNAQRDTELAQNTFDLIMQADYQGYAAFKSINPSAAASFRTFVNKLRAGQYQWLKSARTLTKVYQASKSAVDASALSKAMAVLISATNEANTYLTQIKAAKPSAWYLNDSLIWAQISKGAKK